MTTKRSLALILSPAGILLISAARLIIVSNFNTTTAVTIASTGGVVNTLLGTVVPLVPIFMPYIALGLLLFRHFLLATMTFIFAAFISPTSISLVQGFEIAKTYWDRTSVLFLTHLALAVPVMLLVFVALWIYNRSFIEGISAVAVIFAAVTLLIALPNLHFPMPVQLASNGEHRILISTVARTVSLSRHWQLDLIILALAYPLGRHLRPKTLIGTIDTFGWLLTGTVAVLATIAFLPYVHFIYPIPQNRSYYAEITHDMWLPEERIELNSRLVYYGYVLTSDPDWFTVLLANSRVIVYLAADDLVNRSVCQPSASYQPEQHPPLVPWLYHSPASLNICPDQDELALITALQSTGQSLSRISSVTHNAPERIIDLTNRHLHGKLSSALRRYECTKNWNAPTPVGQRFYYYPSLTPY